MPSIPDPRMNPNGERAYGTVINDQDGHYYVYIKDNSDDDTSSRFFTGGSQVDVSNISPAFLVVPEQPLSNYDSVTFKDGYPENPGDFDNMSNKIEKALKDTGLKLLKGIGEKAVIIDIIKVDGLSEEPNQKVIKELNKAAKKILKDKTGWDKVSKTF